MRIIHRGQALENKRSLKCGCGWKNGYEEVMKYLSIGLSTSYPHFGDKWRSCSQNIVVCGKLNLFRNKQERY